MSCQADAGRPTWPARSTPEQVEKLCELMAKYGLSRLACDDVTLERPAFMSLPAGEPEKKPEEEREDDLQRLARMSPEAQDRALRLDPNLP